MAVDAARPNGEDDLAVFVDRLAAAGPDQATTEAQRQIHQSLSLGQSPPGVRRIAEALAASLAELPPPQRRPADDTASVADAMSDSPLVILDDYDTAATVDALTALIVGGRRVLVTGTDPAVLSALRSALPDPVAGHTLTDLPRLTPAEMRELRRLVALATPEQQARRGQEFPPVSAIPGAAEVAQLCERAVGEANDGSGALLIPTLLGDISEHQRDAVTAVARQVSGSLAAMPTSGEWAWNMLAELIYGGDRSRFDRLSQDARAVAEALESLRSAPEVTFDAPPTPDAAEVLGHYRDFLDSGGRARNYFRSPAQRDVQPMLDRTMVGGRPPESAADLDLVIAYLAIVDRQSEVDEVCAELGIPLPGDEAELAALLGELDRVAAAAEAVGALRHEVLFLAPNSPLALPDIASAEAVARAIVEYAGHGSAVAASRRLDTLADELMGTTPFARMSPEHQQAIAALREHNAPAYATAAEGLIAAVRDGRSGSRCTELLHRLRDSAPALAGAWAASSAADPAPLGLAVFVPVPRLLSRIPPPDSADVVVVLGAASLGVERLLVAAAAPRLVAVVGPEDDRSAPPTMLSILQRAAALVIRGHAAAPAKAPGGQVVPFDPAVRASARAKGA